MTAERTARPWSPGDPWPTGTVRLGEPTDMIRDFEASGRAVWQRIHRNHTTRRWWRRLDSAVGAWWADQITGWIDEDLRELRGIHAVLVHLRAQVEREEDAVDDDAKAWARLRAEGLSETELRFLCGDR